MNFGINSMGVNDIGKSTLYNKWAKQSMDWNRTLQPEDAKHKISS